MLQQAKPTAKTPTHISGDFAPLGGYEYTLTTQRGAYSVKVGSYSGLSITEKRYVTIYTAEGQQVITFDYIRKHTRSGMRCNVTGFGGWTDEDECIEAMSRHWVAWFEARTYPATPAAPACVGSEIAAKLHHLLGEVLELDSILERFQFASLNLGYEVKNFAALSLEEVGQLLAMVEVAAVRRLGKGVAA